MSIDPLYIFVFAGLFSPGPNVILLTASGARFGLRRTLPHVLGVACGVGITSALTGYGIGALLLSQPALTFTLKCLAAGWILWMAWKLFHSTRSPQTETRERPFSFGEAVLFQWINPKVWAIALAASSGYAAGLSPIQEALRLGAAFSGINLFVCLFWTFAGSLLAVLLSKPTWWRGFMTIMSMALASSAAMVFL